MSRWSRSIVGTDAVQTRQVTLRACVWMWYVSGPHSFLRIDYILFTVLNLNIDVAKRFVHAQDEPDAFVLGARKFIVVRRGISDCYSVSRGLIFVPKPWLNCDHYSEKQNSATHLQDLRADNISASSAVVCPSARSYSSISKTMPLAAWQILGIHTTMHILSDRSRRLSNSITGILPWRGQQLQRRTLSQVVYVWFHNVYEL